MIKRALFADELASAMEKNLVSSGKNMDVSNLEDAVASLDSAAEIFQDLGMDSLAEGVLSLLMKVADGDKHVSGLTPDKMVSNLKEHGWVFNDVDDQLYVSDAEMHDFEDEKD